jgi:hypothetical protein
MRLNNFGEKLRLTWTNYKKLLKKDCNQENKLKNGNLNQLILKSWILIVFECCFFIYVKKFFVSRVIEKYRSLWSKLYYSANSLNKDKRQVSINELTNILKIHISTWTQLVCLFRYHSKVEKIGDIFIINLIFETINVI